MTAGTLMHTPCHQGVCLFQHHNERAETMTTTTAHLLPPRSIKRGGPTGRLTRLHQARWTSRFREVFADEFLPEYFHLEHDTETWTPVLGIVTLWRDWASGQRGYLGLAGASATTVTRALYELGYAYSPVRHRFTPDPGRVRAAIRDGLAAALPHLGETEYTARGEWTEVQP